MSAQQIIVSAEPFDVLGHFKIGKLPCDKLRITEIGKSFLHRFANSIEMPKVNTTVNFRHLPFRGNYFTPVAVAVEGETEPWMEMRTVWQILLDYDSGISQHLVTEKKAWQEINIFFSRNNSEEMSSVSAVYVLIDTAGNVSLYAAPASVSEGRMCIVGGGRIFLPHA